MAAPHVAGVAALIISQTGMKGGAWRRPCNRRRTRCRARTRASLTHANLRGFNSEAPQTCTGGLNHNSFYGSGEIDALQAVSQGSTRRRGRAPPGIPLHLTSPMVVLALELPPVACEMGEVALGVLNTVGDVAWLLRGTR